MKYSLVTKERDLKCWQYFQKIFTNKCKQQPILHLLITFKFNDIVYHAPQFKWSLICFLPLSSFLLPSTNICCKAVKSLAFRFPSYWHHVTISRTCVGFWGACSAWKEVFLVLQTSLWIHTFFFLLLCPGLEFVAHIEVFLPICLWQHQRTSIQIDEVQRQVVHLTSLCCSDQ